MQHKKFMLSYKSAIGKLNDIPKTELLLLTTVASVFMPFFITCVMVVVVAVYAVCKREIFSLIIKTKGIIILTVFCALIITVPIFYQRWISVAVGVLALCVLIFFLFAQNIMTVKLYRKSFEICCLMSIWCFAYAVVQKLVMGAAFRATAGLLNANYYATIIEFVILICVYCIITTPNTYKRYIPIIAINVVGLFLCDCQSSWLPIIVGVLILLYFNGYKKHTLVFLVIATIFMVVIIAIPGILPRLDRFPQTFKTRLNIWTTAIEGIKLHPIFGQGSLTYMYIFEQFGGYKTYHAHSLYIDPFLSFGIVGVGLITSYIIPRIIYLFKVSFGKYTVQIKSIMLASVAAVCIHGFTDFSIFWVQTGMLVCLIVSAVGIKIKSD